jgi:hypothetical protein
MHSQTLSITIHRSAADVYAFLSAPPNFAQWAAGLGKLEQEGNAWFVQTPNERMQVQFTARNEFGIVDHSVKRKYAEEIYVPMRVVSNGNAAEILFTLFQQPSMSDTDFTNDLNLVRADLNSLKNLLESSSKKS